ncbi:MAG: Crp/Fnr family transcriptional regulator [Thermoanaerobaculia bacterium]|nr:Crp/Fnr family transcriptional regulator [Thermoanaerobaculia bacterium]
MSTRTDSTTLATLGLFEGLPADSLDQLAEKLRRTVVPPGTQVMSAEQPGEAVYLILDGAVKVKLYTEDGSEVTLALLGPGDTVGEMSLLGHSDRCANVVTIEETTFLWMDRATFLSCTDSIPGLSHNLSRQLSERLRDANDQIRALSTLDVTGRVAQRILLFAERYGRTNLDGSIRIRLPLTQTDIAEMVGASRERVNHVMGDLRKRELLTVSSGHFITVQNVDALKELC